MLFTDYYINAFCRHVERWFIAKYQPSQLEAYEAERAKRRAMPYIPTEVRERYERMHITRHVLCRKGKSRLILTVDDMRRKFMLTRDRVIRHATEGVPVEGWQCEWIYYDEGNHCYLPKGKAKLHR